MEGFLRGGDEVILDYCIDIDLCVYIILVSLWRITDTKCKHCTVW